MAALPPWGFSVLAALVAFCVYSCMYAFRRPFTAAEYAGLEYAGMSYKVWLYSAHIVGYMLSKFIGIKLVSEMKHGRRALWVLGIILVAELALLGFATVPPPWNIPFLFLNGLPLGMVWGIVFSYLEGRRFTDFMGAGLCASFIVASGIVKSAGKWLMADFGISEYWMPFATGALFLVPLCVCLWVLDHLPPPSPQDVALRTARAPMDGPARRRLFGQLGLGLGLLTVLYMLITALREFRDAFMAELLTALGLSDRPALFTTTELPIGLGVLLLLGGLMFVKNNHRALALNHLAIMLGCALVGGCTLAYDAGYIGPVVWLVLVGLGVYLAYVPFNAFLFDRLLAAFQYVGTASFLIMVADSFGYLASVGVTFYKEFGQAHLSWLDFFRASAYALAVVGVCLAGLSWVYFRRRAGQSGG